MVNVAPSMALSSEKIPAFLHYDKRAGIAYVAVLCQIQEKISIFTWKHLQPATEIQHLFHFCFRTLQR